MADNCDVTAISPPSLERELLELWRRFLNRSDINVDDDFLESGGDSFLATELLLEIERVTCRTIPPSILFETGTVRSLLERLGEPNGLKSEIAVRIGGHKGPLFHLFHGDFNHGGISVKTVARMLSPNRPILAIAPHGIGDEPVPISVQQMAVERLPVVRKAQPHGPYLLGGHCNGALVAFEVARLLIADGERVDLVVMIDPVITSVRPFVRLFLTALEGIERVAGVASDARQDSQERAWRKLVKFETKLYGLRRRRLRVARFWNQRWSEKWAAVGRQLKAIQHLARPRSVNSGNEAASSRKQVLRKHFERIESQRIEFLRAYGRAMAAYRPEPLAVPVLYFSIKFDGRAWRRISPKTEHFDLPGSHSLLHKAFTKDALARLQARLDALSHADAIAPPPEFQSSFG